MDCQYCGKSFKTKYTLDTHIKTSKACINFRKEKGVEENIEIRRLSCICGKDFSNKCKLRKHYEICVPYVKAGFEKEKEKLIEDHREEIRKLTVSYEEKLKKTKGKSNTIN